MRVVLLGWSEHCVCGVSDYTKKLATALCGLGVEVLCPDAGNLRVVGVGRLVEQLRSWGATIVHLQYPAMAYRLSVAPVALLSGRPWRAVTTVHEFSQSHVLRKALTLGLLVASQAVVFTTEYERRICMRVLPRVAGKSVVIPIGANLGAGVEGIEQRADRGREDDVVIAYFGLIRPRRGLEEFLELVRTVAERGYDWRFVVVGKTQRGREAYELRMRATAAKMGSVVWVGGEQEDGVLRWLRKARAAYLPYPDGVSERRSSLLAALAAGVPVVTNEGPGATEELREAAIVTRSVDEAVSALRALVSDEAFADRVRSKGWEYVKRRSWERIARMHLDLYWRLIEGDRGAPIGQSG